MTFKFQFTPDIVSAQEHVPAVEKKYTGGERKVQSSPTQKPIQGLTKNSDEISCKGVYKEVESVSIQGQLL
jgi:hypothetical protein